MITAKEAKEIFENSGIEDKAKAIIPKMEAGIRSAASNSKTTYLHDVPSGTTEAVVKEVIKQLTLLGYKDVSATGSYFHIHW